MSTLPRTPGPNQTRLSGPHPALAALIALVTVLAGLLVCNVHVRSIEWRQEYRLMSLSDPARALFTVAERQRREQQSRALPSWLMGGAHCTACSEPALSKRWDELFEERKRYLAEGFRNHRGKRWLYEAEAARAVSLAGWGDAASIQKLRAEGYGAFPDYLQQRGAEITEGNADIERERSKWAGRLAVASFCLHATLIVFGAGVWLVWKGGIRWPKRAARSRLAAPSIGRGLIIFVWAEGFVSVCTSLRWDDPDGPFQIFGILSSLPLALAVIALFVGTRARVDEKPITELVRCPADRRTRRATWTAALATTGVILAFNWIAWQFLGGPGVQHSWTDEVHERAMYASSAELVFLRFSAVFLAPLGEELAYRGAFFSSLTTRMSAHRAALVSAIVFAASHGYGWFGFCSVALSGYLWARLAARTGSLMPGMISHGSINLLVAFSQLAWRL